mmetsp:Transcript_3788/g.6693  ORF Transcript_3788/g.6693 Transcript_3788/m.6693 type:complete len:338 (+) Transcript_3788:100-1113(+)|eukprot:CAMPEP_0201671466 /NCGR_PEP_ID=MMETSP0494-20130426/29691_1 /ASSEMBLY_ACC=CAM_ASM_000839 /TAXON_ID=420259 /ORGANISM="Thalassiosira gravida, Strain GMp14c1" /LENGTH=337 /DNA_ID=CAMNT_0048152841 /DNA_START=42 /DNA_END=1055 /DNA_ORIENTATION=+
MSDVFEPFLYKLGVEVPEDVEFIIVHHSVKALPRGAFGGHRQLKEVQLPKGLEEIGDAAFRDCKSLERITLPTTLIKIGKGSFMACRSLKKVTLPEGLEEIEECSFFKCKSLQRINFPSTLIKIGCHAFAWCWSLKEVALPEGLKEVGVYAFAWCELLDHINCYFTLIRIDDDAFAHCNSLTRVTLVGGVMIIKANTFKNCYSLDRVTIPSKAFVVQLDTNGNSTCRLVGDTIALADACGIIISPERLSYISLPHLLEVEDTISTIMNRNGHMREGNIEQVQALITTHALVEVSTILELALWKNKMDIIYDLNLGTRKECRVMCGSDDIIPGVMSYL